LPFDFLCGESLSVRNVITTSEEAASIESHLFTFGFAPGLERVKTVR